MLEFARPILAAVRVFFRSRSDTALEILALRQQVVVLKRRRPRPALNTLDRLFWTTLRHLWSRWRDVLVIVKPDTLIRWHRKGFRLFWRWTSRPVGRPRLPKDLQELIRKMAAENPTWGEERIANELKLKLGVLVDRHRYKPRHRTAHIATVYRQAKLFGVGLFSVACTTSTGWKR